MSSMIVSNEFFTVETTKVGAIIFPSVFVHFTFKKRIAIDYQNS